MHLLVNPNSRHTDLPSQSHFAVMQDLLREYKSEILPGLSDRMLGQAESHVEFPYSFLSIPKMLVNYSESYFRHFRAAYLEARDSVKPRELVTTCLGPATRMLRYFLLLTLGAHLDTTVSEPDKVEFLVDLAEVAQQKAEKETQLDADTARELLADFVDDDFDCDMRRKRLTSQLAILAREYVDLLFLGEHPLSYQTYVPALVDGCYLIVRRFRRLDYGGFVRGIRTLEFRDLYATDVQGFEFSLFAGSLRGIPEFRRKSAVAVYADDDHIHNTAQLLSTYAHLQTGLGLVQAKYSAMSVVDRELEAARSYSSELECLAASVGRQWTMPSEARRAIQQNLVAGRLLSEKDCSNTEELFLVICHEALDAFLRL